MSCTVPERRSSLRLSIALRMEIEKAVGEPGRDFRIRVIVSNISAGGAYFETDRCQPLDVGTTVEVMVRLPDGAPSEALGFAKLRTSATVLRTQPAASSGARNGTRKAYGVAIRFDRPLSFV